VHVRQHKEREAVLVLAQVGDQYRDCGDLPSKITL
jgi:hypothetical protein